MDGWMDGWMDGKKGMGTITNWPGLNL